MAGVFLSLRRVLPDRLYEWSADELADPRVLGLIRDGNPIYAWPFEERHVWRTRHMPFPARVLEHLTRPS